MDDIPILLPAHMALQTEGLSRHNINDFRLKQFIQVDFLPVLDEQGTLCNLITRRGLSAFLMRNQKFQMDADFETAEGNVLEHEIFARPWGFYKTTVLNELFQSDSGVDQFVQLHAS